MGLGGVVCVRDAPWVRVARQADGSDQATLGGHFTLAAPGDPPFGMRLRGLCFSLLDGPEAPRGRRRTRDGRTPLVRHLPLAEGWGLPQPHSRLGRRYWHRGGWANGLSLPSAEVLTAALIARIVAVCATLPGWGVPQGYPHLRQPGLAGTEPPVQPAVVQSGGRRLPQTLRERYDLAGPALRVRDDWLVAQLLAQVRARLGRLAAGQPLPTQVRTPLADLPTLASETGTSPPPPGKARPWRLRVAQVLWGDWQAVTDGQVRCPYCG